MTEPVARSLLFVPGDREARFVKAIASGADEVILDLEDAVGTADKGGARDNVARFLSGAGAGWVRINAAGTQWHADDVSSLRGLPGLRGIVLPKAESATVATSVSESCSAPVIALIESARGLRRLDELAESASVSRLAFGSIDLSVDIGCEPDWDALLLARSMLVLVSRSAGLPPPIDGVTTVFDRPEVVERETATVRRLGFGGKLCIHPLQVAAVHRGFAPRADELEWAAAVIAASADDGAGASSLDGQMIDKPVLDRARRLLDADRRSTPPSP